MRGVIGRRLSSPNNGFSFISITKQTPFLIKPTSRFSSSSSDGGAGRGRGRGDGGFPNQFGINRESENKGNVDVGGQGRGSSESQSHGGYGHGRGRPIQSDPAFSSFVKPDSSSSLGRGRGGGGGSDPVSPFAPPQQQSQPPPQQPRYQSQQPRFQPQEPRYQPQQPQSQTQQPRYQPQQQRSEFANGGSQGNLSSQLTREDQMQSQSQPHSPPPPETPLYTKEATLPPESKPGQTSPPNNALGSEFSHTNQRIVPESGAGRGTLPPVDSTQTRHHENRHIRPPQPPQQQRSQPQRKQYAQPPKDETPRPQLSREEAGRRARSELSRGEAEGSGVRGRGGGGGRGRGRGARGRGGRGRGGEGWRDDKKEEEAEQEAISVFVGDSADGEKFAKSIGPELMKNLAEGFEDVCERALPSTSHDALVDAYDTNLMIECEPEYAMPDFGSNPDIDEKPPMSLLECLEKVKPFIVAYEGIKDQEEWEEAIDEVMAQAPLIKEIVDHYSGPDRVTAKQQSEELDRIATTLPKSVPDSVKRFADRAALSLKSNPGWGFDKKYQFMDKLVMEVSQNYK